MFQWIISFLRKLAVFRPFKEPVPVPVPVPSDAPPVDRAPDSQESGTEGENSMNLELLDSTILKHEGERLAVYRDTLGNLTVGVGHLVRPEDRLSEGDKITPEQSRALYLQDRDTAIRDATDIFPDLLSYPDTVQVAIVDILYNIGKPKFSAWTNTIDLIKSRDWNAVSAYFNSSAFNKWRSQVGRRVSDIAELFEKAGGIAGILILLLTVAAYFIYKQKGGTI